jgi:hypothetical protein
MARCRVGIPFVCVWVGSETCVRRRGAGNWVGEAAGRGRSELLDVGWWGSSSDQVVDRAAVAALGSFQSRQHVWSGSQSSQCS